jgi:HlyD family secretion protein
MMINNRSLLSRVVLTTLVVAPLGLIGTLTVTVLLPTLKNPESKFYSSGLGYPAVQRFLGKPVKVNTVSVAFKNLEDSVAAPGESVALQDVDIRPLISGPVEKVYVVEGQQVRRGQPLLQIERTPFQNQVNTARNSVKIAESNLAALESSAPKQLVQLKANVDSLKQTLAIAETKLKEISSLTKQQQKSNVESAKTRLAIAETKLQQVIPLVQQGAVTKSQMLDSQDVYTTRKKELIEAQAGTIGDQSQLYVNQELYVSTQNQLLSARQELARTQSDTDKDLANARLTLENNRIALQNALRDLHNTVVYATTDGLVSKVKIDKGEVANVSSPVITLNQDIVFKAYIDQARLNAVKIGDKATIRLVAYPGRTYQGRVIRLNPTVQSNAVQPGKVGIDRQYTYSVWVAVNDLQMPSGLQGYVQFDHGKTTLVVPESGVTHLSAGEGMVMVAKADRAVVKKVKLGRIFDNQREVLEGLTPGEQVIPSARALNPGEHLEIASPRQQRSGEEIETAKTPN